LFTQTHLLIGNAISRVIEKKYPQRMDKKAFQYGCIIPDFCLSPISVPHYINKSFGSIAEMIQKPRSFPQTIKEKQKFYIELGIITHYISDYFCQAHNFSAYRNCISHFIYEGKLSNEFRAIDLQPFCYTNLSGPQNKLLESLARLPAFIKNRHLEYQSEKREMRTDVVFCLEVASTVVLNITHHSQHIALEKAA